MEHDVVFKATVELCLEELQRGSRELCDHGSRIMANTLSYEQSMHGVTWAFPCTSIAVNSGYAARRHRDVNIGASRWLGGKAATPVTGKRKGTRVTGNRNGTSSVCLESVRMSALQDNTLCIATALRMTSCITRSVDEGINE